MQRNKFITSWTSIFNKAEKTSENIFTYKLENVFH